MANSRGAWPGIALALVGLAGCASPTQPLPTELQASLAAERGLPLQSGMQSRLQLQSAPAGARGTLLMYHGFSAGPWQFDELAAQAFAAGYNVYVPRLPGHGFQTPVGAEDDGQLPTGRTASQYEEFAERTYQQAAALGAPVSTLGLSVGGGVAVLVAEKHAEVRRVVAFSPFFRPKSGGALLDGANALDTLPLGLGNGLLSLVPWGWGSDCEAQQAAGKRPGHCHFTLGNINGDYQIGRRELALAGQVQAPVQFFVSGADDAADESAIEALYRDSGGAARNGWYFYPAAEGIPHAMVSPREDAGKGHTPALYAMTLKFLQDGTRQNRGDGPR